MRRKTGIKISGNNWKINLKGGYLKGKIKLTFWQSSSRKISKIENKNFSVKMRKETELQVARRFFRSLQNNIYSPTLQLNNHSWENTTNLKAYQQ